MKKIKNKPIISMISAMDENRGIGYKNKIPWHIKEDLIRFKKLTEGKTIIIGRRTFESLLDYYKNSKRPFPKRKTIVITSQKNYQYQSYQKISDLYFVSSFAEALDLAKKIEKNEIFIAGGAKVFEEGIKYAQKLYLTIVKGVYQADAFFPEFRDFKIIAKEEKKDDKYNYQFLLLEK
ncbi:MAG: dihydrofolate reductase [Patescibacteria group bacterium]|nr:dihydrofolate reductase [Patescibacteria group bacterium]